MNYQTFDEDSLPLDPESPFFWDHIARYWWATGFALEKRVLDVACGRGYGAYILAHVAKEVEGVDLNPGSLTFAQKNFSRPNLKFATQDVTALSGSTNFDLITAFEVIEHITPPTTAAFLEGLKKRLTPEGTLLLSTPNHDVVTKSGMPVPKFHINNFHPKVLRKQLEQHFSRVELLGQFAERGPLNQLLFTLDIWNVRHCLAKAFSKKISAPSSVKVATSEIENLQKVLPYLERYPEAAEKYLFSPMHWRQAGLTIAICQI